MNNLIAVLSICVVLFSLTGCGAANAVNPPCNLSTLRIKSMVLDGDSNGLATAAIKRELFARGARWTYGNDGTPIVGKVTMNAMGKAPTYAVVQATRKPFAGIAYSNFSYPTSAANQIGRRIALDFCHCLAERATNSPPQ
jgi:hypothetical protein